MPKNTKKDIDLHLPVYSHRDLTVTWTNNHIEGGVSPRHACTYGAPRPQDPYLLL